jgi:lysophospholipase L1-like esterase
MFEPAILQTPNCYYGFLLTNGKSGILYHSIGQNGAMFTHYSNSDYMRQLALLQPSLLIITLGTNEAFATQNYIETKFIAQVDEFIRLVKEHLSETAILLTTPAECFRRTRNGYVRNEKISLVANEIIDYARREGLACFDLYGMTGGANSCNKWQEAKLLGRDRIHFSIEGYLEQGKLLYKALIRLKTGEAGEIEKTDGADLQSVPDNSQNTHGLQIRASREMNQQETAADELS